MITRWNWPNPDQVNWNERARVEDKLIWIRSNAKKPLFPLFVFRPFFLRPFEVRPFEVPPAHIKNQNQMCAKMYNFKMRFSIPILAYKFQDNDFSRSVFIVLFFSFPTSLKIPIFFLKNDPNYDIFSKMFEISFLHFLPVCVKYFCLQ
jgi:hypothetical protein